MTPELEAEVLGGVERYTRAELAAAARMDLDDVSKLWRALGFANVGDDRAFTDADLAALLRVAGLLEAGPLDLDAMIEIARSMGQTTARLADWQVETLGRRLTGTDSRDWHERGVTAVVGQLPHLLPELEELLGYVWRRQLAATVGRYLDQPGEAQEAPDTLATVGFADLVAFTRLARELDEAQLAALVQAFESVSADLVAQESARLVKTLGDEVMFVAETPYQAARVAYRLHDTHARSAGMPPLRIGLATGAILNRMGDVFGTTVNRAARLTGIARPGTTVVDAATSEAVQQVVDVDLVFSTRPMTPRPIRGLGLVRPYALVPGGRPVV